MTRHRPRHAAPRRRFPRQVAAVLLAVVIAVTLLVANRCGNQAPDTPATQTTGITLAPPVREDQTFVTMGPLPSAPLVEPEALVWPDDLTWTTLAGVDLPVSTSTGPRDLTGGLARGFARTPAGAVVAVLHLLVRTSPQVGPTIWEPTLRDQVVGPHATAYAEAVRRDYETAREQAMIPTGKPLGRIHATIPGVRIDSYGPTTVWMRLLVEAPDGDDGEVGYLVTVVELNRVGDDWRLVAPPDGDWARVRVQVGPDVAAAYPRLPGR